MFNKDLTKDSYFAKGALEIAIRVREQERKMAILRYDYASEPAVEKKTSSNPFRIMVANLISMVR